MKDFQEILKENSLYGTRAEQEAFILDDTNVAEAFVFNFLGILGLLNGAIDNKRIKRYLRNDKKVRIDSIGVRNNDITLSLKMVYDKGWFRTNTTVNQITRFLAKLKTGQVDAVNSVVVVEWIKSMKLQKFYMALGARLRKIVQEFVDSDDPNLHLLAAQLQAYYRMYPETSGEFNGLIRKTKMMTISQKAEADIEAEKAAKNKYPPVGEAAKHVFDKQVEAENSYQNINVDYTAIQQAYGDVAVEAMQLADYMVAKIKYYDDKGGNSSYTAPPQSSNFNKTKFAKFLTQVLDAITYNNTFIKDIIPNLTHDESYKDIMIEVVGNSKNIRKYLDEVMQEAITGDQYNVGRRIRSITTLKNSGIDILELIGTSFYTLIDAQVTNATTFKSVERLGRELGIKDDDEWKKALGDASQRFIVKYFEEADDDGIKSIVYELSGSNFHRVVGRDKKSADSFANGLYAAYKKNLRATSIPGYIMDTWGDTGYFSFADNHLSKSLVSKFVMDVMENPAKTTRGYTTNVNINNTLRYVAPEDADKVVRKFMDLAKKGNTEWLDDRFAREGGDAKIDVENGKYAEAMSVKIIQTMLNQHAIETMSSEQLVARLDETFEKYLPDVTDKRKSELITTAYQITSTLSRQQGRNGGSEAGRRAQIDLLVYNAEKTGLPLPISPQDALSNGTFDDVQPEQAEGMLNAMNNGKMEYLFAKDRIKAIYRREDKRRVKDFYFGLLFDNIDAHPKLVNEYYLKMETYLQNDMRKHLVGAGALVHALDSGEIKPHTQVTHTRLKQMLSFNDVRVEDVLAGLGLRKKKNEPITEYIKRAQQLIDQSDGGLGNLKIDNEEWTEDKKRIETVNMVSQHRNGNHGDIYPVIKDSFTVSLGEDEWNAFAARMEAEGVQNGTVVPSFHGTGGVAATMILRYGFRVLKSGDASVVGRMLGDGIYFSNKIDKALQYCGNDGYGRTYGTRGYIFDMKSQLGQQRRDWNSAGVDNARTRSPEWVVRDGRAQLKIVRAYEVELITSGTYDKIKQQVDAESTGVVAEGFTPISFEQFNEEVANTMNEERFTFYDGHVFLPDGTDVWFEDLEGSEFPDGVRVEYSSNGIVVAFEGVNSPVAHDIRYCTSMSDNAKDRYFDLLEERIDAAKEALEATQEAEGSA